MMSLGILWGLKTLAWFDVWSIEHVLSGMSIGEVVKKNNAKAIKRKIGDHSLHSWYLNISGVLMLGYAWEALEHYLETGLAGQAVTDWFQGVEFWGNRLVTDPLMLVLGYWIIRRHPRLIVPARICSALWLVVHIFVFPDSMYLQRDF